MIDVGLAAKYLRNRLKLSQRAAAKELGISHVYLSNLENGKSSPTADMIDRYFEAWGVDLYMLAAVKFGGAQRLPQSLGAIAAKLNEAWESQIEATIASRTEEENEGCLDFRALRG